MTDDEDDLLADEALLAAQAERKAYFAALRAQIETLEGQELTALIDDWQTADDVLEIAFQELAAGSCTGKIAKLAGQILIWRMDSIKSGRAEKEWAHRILRNARRREPVAGSGGAKRVRKARQILGHSRPPGRPRKK